MPVLLNRSTLTCVFAIVAFGFIQVQAEELSFDSVAPLLKQYCITCHSGDVYEAAIENQERPDE
jgi:hypothetical protein